MPSDDPALDLALRRKRARLLFLIGSIALLMIGLGHTIGAQLLPALKEPPLTEAAVYTAMALIRPLSTSQHTLHDFYVANGWAVGFCFLAFGAMGIALARASAGREQSVPRSVVIINAAISAACLVLAVLFYPPPPLVFLVISTGCFVASAALAPND